LSSPRSSASGPLHSIELFGAKVLPWAGEALPYCKAGSGETIVAIVREGRLPTRAHALLAAQRRVIVFAMTADTGTSREGCGALAALGVGRFDLMGERIGAAAALWLALTLDAEIGSVVLAGPMKPFAR
jgi:pimeloyl-ACP methyl ester carboxylesterase